MRGLRLRVRLKRPVDPSGARRSVLGTLLGSPRAEPAWTLVGIRVAYWIGAALALLWLPLRSQIAPFHAYEARTDLLFNTFAIALIGTFGTLLSSVAVAYGFSRFRFSGAVRPHQSCLGHQKNLVRGFAAPHL